MKKIYAYIFALLLSIGLLVGCASGEEPENNQEAQTEQSEKGSETEQTEKSDFPVTIKDATDEEVVIAKKPERMVSLVPSNTEIAFELGFEHSQSFSRLFKSKTNLSPLEFRKSFN